MTSDYERTRTLAPLLLKDSLPMKAVAQVVKIASMMSSDNEKASLIVRIVNGASGADAVRFARRSLRPRPR